MPAPNTPRRLSARNTPQTTPSKPATSKAAIAAKGGTPSSVKDRIRQWQDQGGGAVAPPSPVPGARGSSGSSLSATDPVVETPKVTPKATSKPKSNPEPDEDKAKKVVVVRRWVDPDAQQWVRERPRSSSTPRKRVVSDEHWKKNRVGSPRIGQSIPVTAQPRPRRVSPSQNKKSPSQNKTSPGHKTPERGETRRRKRQTWAGKSIETAFGHVEDDDEQLIGLRKLPDARKLSYSDDIIVELESTVLGKEELKSDRTSSPPSKRRSSRRDREKENFPPEEDDGRGRRKTSYAEALESASQAADGSVGNPMGSQRSKKGGILGQIFSKPEPAPATVPRVPTIEAWLDDQSDPFVDDNGPPVAVPAPLKMRSSRRRVSKEPKATEEIVVEEQPQEQTEQHQQAPLDDDSIKRESRRRRRRKTRSSLENGGTEGGSPGQNGVQYKEISSESRVKEQESHETSSSTLRRRGAARGDRSRSRKRASLAADAIGPQTPDTSSPIASPNETGDKVGPLRETDTASRRKRPPTSGRQLSTIESIASADDYSSLLGTEREEDVMLATGPNELRRRLTTNEDLMSVLSLPKTGSRKIRSARSVRTLKNEPPTQDTSHLFADLVEDENKYMRELKTLVDGVIPVLLQCILSKTDMSAAAGLFGSNTSSDDTAITRPIMDMGIALERLKSLHRRIPLRDADSLLSWAQGAHKVYLDYIKSWRMGFQDVIINLAPADKNKQVDAQSEGGMARDAEGDVIDSEGKKADVAHLLRRPLVRLKHLSKTFQQLNDTIPSERATGVFRDYQDLVDLARRKSNEERARLEDEAAASIDPTKARDTRTLAVLPGVTISKFRKVKARDYFELTLHHSSGQRIDCHAELLLRDNQLGDGPGGDVLLCEVDERSRWLLFPPLMTQCLSARIGDMPNEIILMIRGTSAHEQGWHELISLRTDDEQARLEWVDMLGSNPMPPRLQRSQSFINRQKETSSGVVVPLTKATLQLTRTPSPTEIDVPIGEPSVLSVVEETRRSPSQLWREAQRPSSSLGEHTTTEGRTSPTHPPTVTRKPLPNRPKISTRSAPASPAMMQTPFSLEGAVEVIQSESPTRPSNQRSRPSRYKDSSRLHGLSPSTESIQLETSQPQTRTPSAPVHETKQEGYSPKVERSTSPEPSPRGEDPSTPTKESRPTYGRAPSSVPSRELPTIPRTRQNSPTSSGNSTPLTSFMRDQWANISGLMSKSSDKSQRLQKSPKSQQEQEGILSENLPPSPPPHRSSTASEVGLSNVPDLRPQQSPAAEKGLRRRSSSPLKREYAPSTASASSSESDSDSDSTSDTSEDELESDDIPGPLIPMGAAKRRQHSIPSSRPTVASTSLAPSDSASQGPYRKVPTQDHNNSVKAIATAYYWSDKGCWNPIHQDECSIVVSPGMIEAFQMTAAHSGANENLESASDGSSSIKDGVDRPLIGLELTPLVPLRRGTALDISIRSPPVERSRFKASNNIMLRSRNVEECDALYSMINQARINNPTYIALQNARPSYQPPVSFNTGGTQGARHSNSHKRPASWIFGGGGNGSKPSYRASSAPTGPSITGASENSAGTVTSAFRRLSNSGVFNLSRSSVLKKAGGPSAGTASLYSSDSGGTGGGSGSATPTGHGQASMGGINNLKIRLYIREDQNRWRDIGAARLTVFPAASTATFSPPGTPATGIQTPPLSASAPTTPIISSAARGPRLSSANFSPHRNHGNASEKRILVTSSKKTPSPITLLDVCLHESCFERVARTGIAVSVWEEHENGIAKEGGVVGGKAKVYMVQCAGEAEAAWVFGVVGRARY